MIILALLLTLSGQSSDSDVATLTKLEAEWNAAHQRGDVAVLDRLFADDMIVKVPGMPTMMKAGALRVFQSGRMKFDRYESSDINVQADGSSAVVTGRLKRTRTNDGKTVEDDWRFTKTYKRLAKGWQVVSFYASNATP